MPSPSRRHDIATLLLRITVGGLMLFHGVDKLGGVEWMGKSLAEHGLPALLRYGVYAGEIVAPVLIILGIFTRTGAGLLILTLLMAIYLLHMDDIFAVGKHGEYALELHVFYIVTALAVAITGPGRFAIPMPRNLRRF